MNYIIQNHTALIFTDLDATFLDKDNFSFANNVDIANKLVSSGNYVIFNTSKTFAEIIHFFEKHSISFPFICENGAAIYLPPGIIDSQKNKRAQFEILFESKRIDSSIRNFKKILKKRFGPNIIFFNDLSHSEQLKLSGLEDDNLKLAVKREYSELILFNSIGSKQIDELYNFVKFHNFQLIKGGRFFHLSYDCNKGFAMQVLVNTFKKYYSNREFITIALGDNENDIGMLNQANYPCLISGGDDKLISKKINSENLIISKQTAPEGWIECINNTFKMIRG